MANINIQIPDANLQEVIDGLCDTQLPPFPSTAQNAKLVVINFIKKARKDKLIKDAHQAITPPVDITLT